MPLPRLMLVTDRRRCRGRDLVDVVGEAAAGGVTLVQVREKDLGHDALRGLVERLGRRVGPEVRLIVNSAGDVARATGAGLHLPAAAVTPDSLPSLLGRSVHDPDEARRALADPVRYLLAGTVFPTRSKPGRPGAGPGLLTRVRSVAGDLPVFGIGGVTAGRIAQVIHAGAHGVAVSGAILEAERPGDEAARLNRAIEVALGG